jgi:carbon-monoxide dehydrogenase large subunit
MSDDHDAMLSHLKFGIGQSVPRKEDPKLVTGRGRFTDDVDLPGQVFAHPLRSHSAHGILRHLDVGEALAAPGVLAVYTAADMARAGYGPLRC